jgi:hypothetical protein
LQIWRLNSTESVDDDLFALASGPDMRVRSYSSCVVNGVRFCTVDRDENKKTQNCGVACASTHNEQPIDFYGKLNDIIELQYNSRQDGTTRSVVVFRCDWYKLDGKRTAIKDDGFFRSINIGSLWYKKDCFILATQARQIFYLPDNKHGRNWQLVQMFKHRHLYNVNEQNECTACPYQEAHSVEEDGRRPEVQEIVDDLPLNRDDEDRQVVDSAEVTLILNQNQHGEAEGSDDEDDDTFMEYCSEDEHNPMEVDSDDE